MDKSTILKEIKPDDIFLKFLRLESFPKKNISSPFAEDKKESFSIYQKNGNRLYKCHSTGKSGDCFQLVADLNNLDCQNDFNHVIEIIKSNLNIYNTDVFTYNKTPFKKHHLDYFNQGNWNINKDLLDKYNVSAIDSFTFFNKSKNKDHTSKIYSGVSAFIYELGDGGEVYIPKQSAYKKKFFLNKTQSKDIFGIKQLEPCEDLIISAGKKDCLILNSNGFPSISFRSENHKVTKKQIQLLQQKAKNIYVLFDNDDSGLSAANRICKEHKLTQIKLNTDYNDVADYFQVYKKEDFRKLFENQKNAAEARKKKIQGNTIFHQIEDFLSTHYDIRFNTLDLDLEISEKSQNNWNTLKIENLYIELKRLGFKFSIGDLQILLRSDYIKDFDPLKSYFKNLPQWDQKVDYISKFSNYVRAENQERFNYHFKKWCMRAAKCAIDNNFFNKQAFILSDDGIGQNIGKSSWCRFLNPKSLKKYIAEDFSNNDKDSRILLCKNFLINLDELAQLNKKEINSLKSMFSKTQINERLPYDRKNSILPRKSSFIGSTNQVTFLSDETGSVRWLCFVIKDIDWAYSKEFNIDNLWSQVVYLLKNKTVEYNMTRDDINQNEEANKQFKILTTEQELIDKHYEPSNGNGGEFLTSTDIKIALQHTGEKLNSVQIGKALTSLGFKRERVNRKWGYRVINRL